MQRQIFVQVIWDKSGFLPKIPSLHSLGEKGKQGNSSMKLQFQLSTLGETITIHPRFLPGNPLKYWSDQRYWYEELQKVGVEGCVQGKALPSFLQTDYFGSKLAVLQLTSYFASNYWKQWHFVKQQAQWWHCKLAQQKGQGWAQIRNRQSRNLDYWSSFGGCCRCHVLT